MQLYFAIVNLETPYNAHLSVRVKAGSGLSTDLSQSRLADILVQGWD